MKDAIQKAIEGGWMITDREGEAQEWHERHPINENPERIWCDAFFWQCLDEALGWDNKEMFSTKGEEYFLPIHGDLKGNLMKNQDVERKIVGGWLYNWHRFIDHLASGGDADEFFKQLLK